MKSLNSSEFAAALVNDLLPLDDVARLIEGGSPLALAGTAKALSSLPEGNWIGGTTPYFMTAEGGTTVSDDLVFVTDLSPLGSVTIKAYTSDLLEYISHDVPDHGFAIAIFPFESPCHTRFAMDAPGYPLTFVKPVVGWIAGYNLDEGGKALAFDGRERFGHQRDVVVAHIDMGEGGMAMPAIVNPFKAGEGEVITFLEPGFIQRTAIINGVETDFAAFVREKGLDHGELPLVGDYAGAAINVSVQQVEADGSVHLYAPAFPGVEYRFAAPLEDYAATLRSGIDGVAEADAVWSCNCILNFLFGKLEGQAIGGIAGPVTFGEVAFQLLNQTYVTVNRV